MGTEKLVTPTFRLMLKRSRALNRPLLRSGIRRSLPANPRYRTTAWPFYRIDGTQAMLACREVS